MNCSYGWDDDGERYIHVKASEKGIAKLYAQDWNENGKRDECTVYVGGEPVTGIELDFTNKTMHIGEEDYLWMKITPSDALNLNFNWSSSNKSIADVDSAGKVYTKSIGTAIITARTEDGGYTAKCTISVVEGIIIEKTDAKHNRIVFPNGKIWNCINFDIINGYNLDQNKPESQRFYDNVYETKVYDSATGYTYYYEPLKEYTDEELKILYMIDPHGMAAYVREYAGRIPNYNDSKQTRLKKIMEYKDSTFFMLFDRMPEHYIRRIDGKWIIALSNNDDYTDIVSESEFLFGRHVIYDMVTLREFISVAINLISIVIMIPAFKQCKVFNTVIPNLLKYLSLSRSVIQSILNKDFNEFMTAIVNGVADEEELESTMVISGKEIRTENYTLSWAFSLMSLSSDLEALAETFNNANHFYKEVFTQCSNDTSYDIYFRAKDGNLVAISDITDVMN